MRLKAYIELHRPSLESSILDSLKEKQKAYQDKALYLQAIKSIKETVTAGKLMRGILVLLAYESKKLKVSQDSIKLAAAVELIHTGLLIHDDIMDNDHLRRGKPTVFAQAIQMGKENHANNPQTYGNAVAICIGDLCFFMAYELIGQIKDTSKGLKILEIVSKELQEVGYAQITDIHYGLDATEPSEEEILELYRLKTARYSFSLPLKIGGILADCNRDTIEKLENFGESIGVLFQIKDDELEIFGDESIIGKTVGSDIRENKKTLIRKLLFNAVDKVELETLKSFYGNSMVNSKDISVVKQYLSDYKIMQAGQKFYESNSLKAKNIINGIDMPNKYKDIFVDLVKFITNREK